MSNPAPDAQARPDQTESDGSSETVTPGFEEATWASEVGTQPF